MGTMRTIEENNGLIAEFLGVDINENGTFELPQYGTIRPNGDFKTEFDKDKLRYHKDWNWLIPAVIKCKERQFFGSNSLITRLNNALVQADIELVYEQVIEFINYYNKQDDTI